MTDPYRRAHHLTQAGRYEEAERILRAGLAEEPADGRLLTLLASVLRMRREYPAALAAAEAAVAASPHLADAHAERAENLILLIRSKDAVAAAGEAVRLDQLSAPAHLVLARSLAAAHDHEGARAAAARGLSLDPRSVEGLLTVAEVERDAGNRDAATAAARAALAIEPENSYGRWLIAMLDAERLRVRRSMRGLRDVARISPARPDLIAMTWPIRGVLGGLRRGLFVGAVVVCALLLAGHWWWPTAATFARLVSGVLAAVLAGFGARVLLPAGRLPWRCLPLLPALMRRSTYAALAVQAAAIVLLVVHAAAGRWPAAVLALALVPVLWALSLVEMLGAGLDDPGIRHALRSLGGEFRDWWITTKRDLRAAWKDDPQS
ncbi:tetratricopeptide repeat protein [Actinoplanes sp. NPDC051513]|uniref:tetratricopeptide repeat protein n=1 Tax=Actinoplanes sp. NPDC051513 TaxID=3363908 RepID=UPI00379AE5E4